MDLVSGPDGGVYIADWSDTGECHDHDGVHRTSGRIYKLVYGAPRTPAGVDVAGLEGTALRGNLLVADQWWNRAAVREWQKRALRGDDLAADIAWLRERAAGAADPAHRLRALWALAAINQPAIDRPAVDQTQALDETFLLARLDDPDPFVRSWGVRLLVDACSPGGRQPSPAAVERLVAVAATDRAGPVQLHLASAVGRLADGPAWNVAGALAAHDTFATDAQFPKLVWFGLAPSVARHPDAAVALAGTAALPQVRHNLARWVAGRVDERPEIVATLLKSAVDGDPSRRRDLVTGLADGLRGWRQASPPAGYAEMSAALAASSDEATVQAVRELDVLFGEGRGMETVRQVALDGSAAPEARRQAVRTLVATVPEDGATLLQGLLGDRPVIAEALAGLAR